MGSTGGRPDCNLKAELIGQTDREIERCARRCEMSAILLETTSGRLDFAQDETRRRDRDDYLAQRRGEADDLRH